MQAQAELISLPQTLTEMFTRGRADRERAVRGFRWGEGPIHVVADARALSAGMVARYAIEDLLQRPAIIDEATSFQRYSLATVRTGSLVVAVSGEGEAPELLEAVRAARSKGAQVLALAQATSPIAEAAQHVFLLPEVAGNPAEGMAAACLQHATAVYMVLIAARQLTRPTPALERLEADWAELPAALDKIVSQFANAVGSLASELGAFKKIFFAGEGLQFAAALRAADAGGHRGPQLVLALDYASLRSGWLDACGPDTGALLFPGLRSRSRKEAATLAQELQQRKASVFAVTDASDHELGRQARLTLLLPDMADLPASILALALAGWTAREIARPPKAART
jgi:glutamine---fructose-6-phosphate transaminase (isomerizing)